MKISKFIKWALLVVTGVLLIILTVTVSRVSDLRINPSSTVNNPAKARRLLQEMGEAHGISRWDSLSTYRVVFGEEFYGTIGKMGSPFKESKVTLSMNYVANSSTGQLSILTGEGKNETWHIENGSTYTLNEAGVSIAEDNTDMKFWIPTYQYFVEFAKRIQEATAVEYVGLSKINGHEAEGVLASWNTVTPQRDIDQYIIWIDTSTKRIVKIDYTIREMFPFLTGGAYFENYKDFNGILLPTEFPVESNLVSDGLLHKMSILDFEDTSGGE